MTYHLGCSYLCVHCLVWFQVEREFPGIAEVDRDREVLVGGEHARHGSREEREVFICPGEESGTSLLFFFFFFSVIEGKGER